MVDPVGHPDPGADYDASMPARCPDCGGIYTVDTSNELAGRVECSAGCGRYLGPDDMESTYCGSICRQCLPIHLAGCDICRSDMQ